MSQSVDVPRLRFLPSPPRDFFTPACPSGSIARHDRLIPMNFTNLRTAAPLALLAIGLSGCNQEIASADGEVTSNLMVLQEAANGFGQLVPHTIRKLDAAGQPTAQVVNIRTLDDLSDNVSLGNPVRPVPKFPVTAILPTGSPGNHFIYASFSQPIALDSVLSASPGSLANSGFTGAVVVLSMDPLTGESLPIPGRAFINGYTYAGPTGGSPPQLTLQRWIEPNAFGQPVVVDPKGQGFPGTDTGFNGAERLVGSNVVVFIPDADDDLTTYETFPEGVQIRMEITAGVISTVGRPLEHHVLACTTVGEDTLGPEVISSPPPQNSPAIIPGSGDLNVDPLTTIRISFTEPVQPLSVGAVVGQGPPSTSSLVKIQFGPSATRTDMPFTVEPVSIFDFSTMRLNPGFNFPGSGPLFNNCNTFATVDIIMNAAQLRDLAQNPDPTQPGATIANKNLLAAATFFTTGEGPGLVNAPVMPDTILLGRSGSTPGISVLDLNGFGQSTGNPSYVLDTPLEGDTKFIYNPNLRVHTGLRPSLLEGTCTIDGGSAGVFTLTRDSSLNDLLVRAPLLANVSDMMLGWALDVTFNNAQFPFGCQASGGDLCTLDGLKQIAPVATGANTLGPAAPNQFGSILIGAPNIISWAPHPIPPPQACPPPCVSPYLAAKEPTSIDHNANQGGTDPKQNLLGPGNPFGTPLNPVPEPPSGLLTQEQNGWFIGPSTGQIQVTSCLPYQIRQQIGHYLYVLDRQRREVTVINSNRMTVVDRIEVADPTSLAMGPNLDFLAISNQSADTVSFVDINPNSSTFHQVVKTTVVGQGPRGLAWEPGNEDLLVCNEVDSTLSLISAFSLEVRREVGAQLNEPFELCVFPRQLNFGFNRGVYFSYILNRNGTVAVFESGPNGVNGWGFDDVVGVSPFIFQNPKTIRPDPLNLQSAAWVVHEGPFTGGVAGPVGEGAVSLLWVESALGGQIPLGTNFTNPTIRSMEMGIQVSVGEDRLSGVPVDIAFDNLRNLGGLPQVTTTFSSGAGSPQNGKGLIRTAGGVVNVNEAQFAFVAVPNSANGSGVLDVLEIGAAGVPLRDANPYVEGIQSIAAAQVTVAADYWRQ